MASLPSPGDSPATCLAAWISMTRVAKPCNSQKTMMLMWFDSTLRPGNRSWDIDFMLYLKVLLI